jgi:7,8-dihydroneopterin aldolase/epimerase/oxygenase
MPDRIVLQGIQFYAYHGVPAEERAVGHRFEVDVEVECDLTAAGRSDDVADTIDYGHVARRVVEIGRERPFHLIEALAAALAERLLSEHPRAERVRVRVRKMLPPIDGVVAFAGVEIERERPWNPGVQ